MDPYSANSFLLLLLLATDCVVIMLGRGFHGDPRVVLTAVFFFCELWAVLWSCAGSVGAGSGAEESGVGAQAGGQCYHEHPEEALHQGLQLQAV